MIAVPDVEKLSILYTGASLTAFEAVIVQVQDAKERTFYDTSKAFSKTFTIYFATKGELFTIVTFTRHFKHYLLGRSFKIVKDHRALQWLNNFKDPGGFATSLLEKLAAFGYGVQHRPGKSNGYDGPSRIPIVNQVATSQYNENQDEPMKDNELFETIQKKVIFVNQKTD